MDAFEQVVAEILWRKGYWVRTSVKVELTKEDKQIIQSPFSPRWELDVVAYKASDNSLLAVECKSYLNSPGVSLRGFDLTNEKDASKFKLFNKPQLRDVVFNRLRNQFAASGSCRADPSVTLCLACGHIASEKDRAGLREHFTKQGWELWDEAWLHDHLLEMAGGGYENQVSAVVTKLLIKNKSTAKKSEVARA